MPVHILTIDIYDSHTQADKIDRLLYKKILYQLQFTTAYYSCKGHDPWHTLYKTVCPKSAQEEQLKSVNYN